MLENTARFDKFALLRGLEPLIIQHFQQAGPLLLSYPGTYAIIEGSKGLCVLYVYIELRGRFIVLIPTYCGVCDVEKVFRYYFKTLTNKVAELIRLKGLEDRMDEEYIKESLILEGRVCFTRFEDFDNALYALAGNYGGEPDCYKVPSEYVIANPILGSKTVKVRHLDGRKSTEGLEGIVVGLTHLDAELAIDSCKGLYDLIYNYAGMLADNFVSLNCAQINSRVQVAYVADNQNLANSAEAVLKDLYNGKPFKVLTQDILNKLTISPVVAAGSNDTIISLIEAHATILSDFWAELGIAYNGNRKRQYINNAEAAMDTGALSLNIDSIINSIKSGLDRVNELFGTNISVEVDENALENMMNGTVEIEGSGVAPSLDPEVPEDNDKGVEDNDKDDEELSNVRKSNDNDD